MARPTKMSLRITLVFSVGVLLLVMGLGITLSGWVVIQADAQRQARSQARALLDSYGQSIGKDVGLSIKNAQTAAATVESLVADPALVNRDQIGGMIRHLVEANPGFVGMTPVFDANALDGRDAEFVSHPMSDANGRFVPYYYWTPEKTIALDKLVMTTEAGIDSWYTKPIAENRDLITPPYLYPVGGKKILMTSAVAVIRRDASPIGVVTTDIALTDLVARAEALRPFGEGRVSIVAGSVWVANADPALLGAPVADKPLMALLEQSNASRYAQGEIKGPKGMMLRAAAPVTLPGVSDTWHIVVEAPMSAVMAGANKALTIMVLAGLAFMAAALAVLWYGARLLTAPMQSMTTYMDGLASGDYSVDVPFVARRDEIGAMARSVEVFRDAIVERQAARRREEADQARAAAERAERDAARRQETAERERVMSTLADGLTRLSAGDLIWRIETAFPPAYESLRRDFNAAVQELEGAFAVLATSAQSVRAGSSEITSAADDLSRRTEQQAASIEETAAALDEITSTVRQTAQGAEEARRAVASSRESTEQSRQIVTEAIGAMRKIESSSNEISQIVGVIDEIAFQTNLLALNAGVEAARAGEAGRGFAVVAQEVRALAQRSAEAAKEIKGLISESSRNVSAGVTLIGQAGGALESVTAQAAEIDQLVGAISASAREQATGLAEVNIAVNQMDQVTQQNAAMVEETNAASHGLASEAQQLGELVSRFQHGDAAMVEARARAA